MHLGYLNESKQEKSPSKKREIWNSQKRKKMINHFSSMNCSLIKYLCLRWRMTIFHYPFTDLKLSASYPLLSLIISFINPDQGLPSTLEVNTRKVRPEIMNDQVLVLKRKVLNLPCWKWKCANTKKAQARKKQKQAKKKKEMGKNPSWKGSTKNRKKKIEGQKS